MAQDGKHGPIAPEIDRVIAPLTTGDMTAIDIEDFTQLAPIEPDILRHAARSGE